MEEVQEGTDNGKGKGRKEQKGVLERNKDATRGSWPYY